MKLVRITPALILILFCATASLAGGDPQKGAQTFRNYCTTCHGASAQGDGPLAKDLIVPPADLTKIAERSAGVFPAESVHLAIRNRRRLRGHGSVDMPAWGQVFRLTEGGKSETEVKAMIEDLVAYIESVQTTADKKLASQ